MSSNIEKNTWSKGNFEYWFKCSYCKSPIFVVPTYSPPPYREENEPFVLFCKSCANSFVPIPDLKEMTPEVVQEINDMIDNFKLVEVQEMLIEMIGKLFDLNPQLVTNTVGEDLKKAYKIYKELIKKE